MRSTRARLADADRVQQCQRVLQGISRETTRHVRIQLRDRRNLNPRGAPARNLLEVPLAGRMVLCRIPNGLNGRGAFRLLRKMDLPIARTPMTGNDMKRYSVSPPR